MSALTCDICGGNLTMNESGDFAVCESCGMKHDKRRVRTKVQEIQGVVEVTKGEAEKNRLLDNANAFINLKEFGKAEKVLRELINDYPNDIKCRLFNVKYLFLRLDPRFSKLDYEECSLPPKISLAYNSLLQEIEKAKRLDKQCISEIKDMWQEHNLRNTTYIEKLTKNESPLYAIWDLIILDCEKIDIHSSEIRKARIGTIINEYEEMANKLVKKCPSSKLINILFSANSCFRPECYHLPSGTLFQLEKLKKQGRDWWFCDGEYIDRIISIDYLSQTEAICFVYFRNLFGADSKKQIYVRFTKPVAIDELAALMNSTFSPE